MNSPSGRETGTSQDCRCCSGREDRCEVPVLFCLGMRLEIIWASGNLFGRQPGFVNVLPNQTILNAEQHRRDAAIVRWRGGTRVALPFLVGRNQMSIENLFDAHITNLDAKSGVARVGLVDGMAQVFESQASPGRRNENQVRAETF